MGGVAFYPNFSFPSDVVHMPSLLLFLLNKYETALTLCPRGQLVISRQLEWLGANMGYFADSKNFHFVVKSSFEPIFFYFEVVTSLKVQPEPLRHTEIP